MAPSWVYAVGVERDENKNILQGSVFERCCKYKMLRWGMGMSSLSPYCKRNGGAREVSKVLTIYVAGHDSESSITRPKRARFFSARRVFSLVSGGGMIEGSACSMVDDGVGGNCGEAF